MAGRQNQRLAGARRQGDKDAMKTLLSIGHGYSAQALARRLLPAGWRIIGTTRSAEGAATLRATGVEALVWPGDDLGPALADATHLLTSVAPGDSDPVLAALGPAIAAAGRPAPAAGRDFRRWNDACWPHTARRAGRTAAEPGRDCR
jgi:hypothetical protein